MFDVEKFIDLIKKYPAIYDQHSQDYKNKYLKEESWSEIGEAMIENWHDLSQEVQQHRSTLLLGKWKSIRDNFVREYKMYWNCEAKGERPSKKMKYMHYDRLMFLAPFVKGLENAPNTLNSSTVDDSNTEILGDLATEVRPTHLLEIIFGEEGGGVESKNNNNNNSKKMSRPQRRILPKKSVTPGNSEEWTKNSLKSTKIRLPEEWRTDQNATETVIPQEWMIGINATESATSRITDVSKKDQKATKSEISRNTEMPVTSRNSVSESVHENAPFHSFDRNPDKFGNKAFLQSFAPIMDSLPRHLCLQARLRITEVFNEVVSNIPPEIPTGSARLL